MTSRPNNTSPSRPREARSLWRGRFFWKLFLGNALLLAVVVAASLGAIISEFDRFRQAELISYLKSQATALQNTLEAEWQASNARRLDAMVKEIASSDAESVRITLVGPDGRVWADSTADPPTLDSHSDRPEIRQARAEGWGQAVRWSDSILRELNYVALRVGPAEAIKGYVRVALPLGVLAERTGALHRLVWTIGLSALAAAIFLAMGLAILWSNRISRITSAARELSRGDLDVHLDIAGSDEVALLARSLNRMRDRIAAQLAAIDGQRRTLESLLGQLHEGVVVVRPDGRVLRINEAAVRLLNVPAELAARAGGSDECTVERCFPQYDLQRLLLPPGGYRPDPSGDAENLAEARLELSVGGSTVSLLARASDILLPEVDVRSRGAGEERVVRGRLLVLTDISDLARAIRLRTNFVANASHELRTPLSAIRGAAETLAKMDVREEAAAASRFVDMIARHVMRLEDLVNDLLNLSRVESPGARFDPVEVRVERFVGELVDQWDPVAKSRNIRLESTVGPDCTAFSANPHLLQLVLDNLIDNAVKFSEPGGCVTLRVQCVEGSVHFEVADQGCGIPAEEQERVFERFYQVARSRSGTGSATDQPRGTGLGLSIVKHAVAALGGTLQLESAVGKGTTVTVAVSMNRPRVVDTP